MGVTLDSLQVSGEKSSIFWKWRLREVTPISWPTGITELAANLEVVYGAQGLRGKILSRKVLGPAERFLIAAPSLWQ
jgi:hypothetical protein